MRLATLAAALAAALVPAPDRRGPGRRSHAREGGRRSRRQRLASGLVYRALQEAAAPASHRHREGPLPRHLPRRQEFDSSYSRGHRPSSRSTASSLLDRWVAEDEGGRQRRNSPAETRSPTAQRGAGGVIPPTRPCCSVGCWPSSEARRARRQQGRPPAPPRPRPPARRPAATTVPAPSAPARWCSGGRPCTGMPPPTRNIAAVPATEPAHQPRRGGEDRAPGPLRQRPLTGAPAPGPTSSASRSRRRSRRRHRHRHRHAGHHQQLRGQRLAGDDAQRDGDDLGRARSRSAPRRALSRSSTASAGASAASAAPAGAWCTSFSKPSKHRYRPPTISSGITAQGAKALIASAASTRMALLTDEPRATARPPAARGRR